MLVSRNRTARSKHRSLTLASASPLQRWMFLTHFNSMEFCLRTRKRSFPPSTGSKISHTTKKPHEHWILQHSCGFLLWCEGGDLNPLILPDSTLIFSKSLLNHYFALFLPNIYREALCTSNPLPHEAADRFFSWS